MARGRKSEHIKTLTGRDTTLLRQLDRTGLAAHDQAQYYCGISSNRLNKLEKSGYVKTMNMTVDGTNTRLIKLGEEGRKFCKENYGTKYFYHAQSNHTTHDLKLTETYYNLPKEVQETWKNEAELTKQIYDSNPGMKEEGSLKTCVDAAVSIDGKIIAIEVVGSSYTQADIELKEEIAINLLNCERVELI